MIRGTCAAWLVLLIVVKSCTFEYKLSSRRHRDSRGRSPLEPRGHRSAGKVIEEGTYCSGGSTQGHLFEHKSLRGTLTVLSYRCSASLSPATMASTSAL